MAQGEYIAPEKIENVYAKCKFVAQCFVYGKKISSCFCMELPTISFADWRNVTGDSLNSSLVAVVCVEPDVLKDWATSEGIKVILILSMFSVCKPLPMKSKVSSSQKFSCCIVAFDSAILSSIFACYYCYRQLAALHYLSLITVVQHGTFLVMISFVLFLWAYYCSCSLRIKQ